MELRGRIKNRGGVLLVSLTFPQSLLYALAKVEQGTLRARAVATWTELSP